jgi:hypothetical protein
LGLDPAPSSDSAISYNRFAAMPSLHYAWALLVMVGAFKVGGIWLKITGFMFQALMFVAIIATANHYVLDAVAGALLLLVSIYAARHWGRFEGILSKWTQAQSAQLGRLNELKRGWRLKVGQIEVPDLRQQFLSGFILRGGHAIRPNTPRASKSPPVHHGIQQSFLSELYDLSLVLS